MYKTKNTQLDSYASAVKCTKLVRQNSMNWFYTSSGQKITRSFAQWHKWVNIPNYETPEIADQKSIVLFRSKHKELLQFNKAYPASRPHLSSVLARMKIIEGELQKGMVSPKGVWMTQQQHELNLARAIQNEDDAHRRQIAKEQERSRKSRKEQRLMAERKERERIEAGKTRLAVERRIKETQTEKLEKDIAALKEDLKEAQKDRDRKVELLTKTLGNEK